MGRFGPKNERNIVRKAALALALVFGIVGADAAFVMSAQGAERPPGLVPGHLGQFCYSSLRGCAVTFIPPQIMPWHDRAALRGRTGGGNPQERPVTPYAQAPDTISPGSGVSPTGPDIDTRSYGGGYFDLPRPPEAAEAED